MLSEREYALEDQAEQVAYARAFADLTVSVEGPGEEAVTGASP